MLSVGRIFADSDDDSATTGGPGGRRSAAAGWRYLWEQVAEGAEDYYSADVARGETAGRWSGSAAAAELGLCGEVTEDQMERVFGRLMHPTEDQVLGQEPRHFRSTGQRLAAAEAAHHRRWTAEWAQREIELVAAGASAERITDELAAHREAAGERWAETEATIRRGGERAAIAGFDLCCSPPKSVSVLWAAADGDGREAIWRAHREGVTAALAYVEREASWSRVGFNGVRQVDTSGLVVASFDHRMSRAGDVQIHTHNAVLNRVRCDDGQWRTLDSRALHQVTAAAGAVYDRVREAALERDLGVRHERRKPDGSREIVGVADDVCRLFSTRRAQIEGRLAELVAAYRDRHGVAPSPWAVAQMSQWATLETRKTKDRVETTAEALARWEAQSRERLGRSLAGVWDQATAAGAAGVEPVASLGDDEVLAQAIATVDAEKASWTRYDLARAVTNTVHVDGTVDAARLLARVDRLVDTAVGGQHAELGVVRLTASPVVEMPPGLRRTGDDTSVYERHGTVRFSTGDGLAAERRVLAGARRVDGPRLDTALVERCLAAETPVLGDDQGVAARQVLMSGRAVEALVGPAGTGKTHTMGAVARAWRAGGGHVLGLAVAETAARTLAGDAEITAVNTAKLLFEHAHRSPVEKTEPGWRDRWAIRPGALVILDEAGMASRQVIDDVARLCETSGAKLLLVGDPEQLAAPAAGGTFALVVAQAGAATLGEVRRFEADWERRASLRLRAGDPGVLAEYDLRARITGGDETEMESAALTAALADRLRGKRSLLLADTNDTAARLAGRLRERLVAAGRVDDSRAVALGDGNWAGAGDRIVTRRNDRTVTAGGRFVANRDTWQVTDVYDDGAVTAVRVDPDSDQMVAGQQVRFDPGYVAEQVQLEYAATVHAVQGATRTTCHAVVSERTSRDALYVALTRGVESNRAYVICDQTGGDAAGPSGDPLAVLAAILERDDPPDQHAATAVAERSAEEVRSLATLFPIWQDLIAASGRQRWQAAVEAVCGEAAAAAMVTGSAWAALAGRLRVLDAAGADSSTLLAAAAASRTLMGVDDVAAVLHWRLRHHQTAAAPLLEGTFAEVTPAGADDVTVTAAEVAAAMDARTVELATRVADQPPLWAAQLGVYPADEPGRVEWRRRAGVVAGYREALRLDQNPDVDTDPIGPLPPPGCPDAAAWWHRAAAALNGTGPAALAALPDERLEAIVEQAHQTTVDAPPLVAGRLRAAHTQLADARDVADHALVANPATPVPDDVAADTALLTTLVERLEADHHRRQLWEHTTSRLHAQGVAAAAELAGRVDAARSAPLPDRDTATVAAQLAAVEQRLAAAATVADTHHARAARWQARAEQLHTQLQAGPPHPHAVTVTAERVTAGRIDTLRGVLDRSRLHPDAPRGHHRADLIEELARLTETNPALAVPGEREPRWAAILERGDQAATRWATARTNELDDAHAQARHHHAIADAARGDIDDAADHAATLRHELDHRHSPTTTPDDAPDTVADPVRRRPAPDETATGMDLDELRAALAAAEQRLGAATYVADRHHRLARQAQSNADNLAAQLAHVTATKPHGAIAEQLVDADRSAAARYDEIKTVLDHHRLGLPTLRGAPRDSHAIEARQLLHDNPVLRHDPILRPDIWQTRLQAAAAKDQQWADQLRDQLHQALTDIDHHSAIAEPARHDMARHGQQVTTLRAELDARTQPPDLSLFDHVRDVLCVGHTCGPK